MSHLVGDVDSGGGCAGTGGVWEVSAVYAQFCCDPKMALKKSLLKLFLRSKYEAQRDWSQCGVAEVGPRHRASPCMLSPYAGEKKAR